MGCVIIRIAHFLIFRLIGNCRWCVFTKLLRRLRDQIHLLSRSFELRTGGSMLKINIGLLLLAFYGGAMAFSTADQDRLIKAVKELCFFPDRTGELVHVEGNAKVGAPVILRFLNAEVSGKVSYDTWKGFGSALDKYKTDPRQCSMEVTKLLVTAYLAPPQAVVPRSNSQTSDLSAKIFLRKNSLDETYFSEPLPSMVSLVVSNRDTGSSVAFVRYRGEDWSPPEATLLVQSSNTGVQIEVRATYPDGGTTRSTCLGNIATTDSSRFEVKGYLTDDALANSNPWGAGLIYKPPTQSDQFPVLRIPNLKECRLARVAG